MALNGGRPTVSLNLITALRATLIVGYFFGSFPTSTSIQSALTASALAAARTALSLPRLCGSAFAVLCRERQYHTSLNCVVEVIHPACSMSAATSRKGFPAATGYLPLRFPPGVLRST